MAFDEDNPEQPSEVLTTTIHANVLLLPLAPGSLQGNVCYVVPEGGELLFSHLRYRKGRVLNTASSTGNDTYDETEALQLERAVYGGVLFRAFGHFIAESLHRLWAVLSDPALGDWPIVYHSVGPGLDGKFPGWMTQIFTMIGIDRQRIVVVDQPINVNHLVVPSQGSLIGYGPVTERYRSLFPPTRPGAGEKPARSGHLYVSRSKYIHSGSYLGEGLIEQLLLESGRFEVIHPQELPVARVVEMLEACESAIFAEGSAIHILELCRNPPPKAFIILRRSMAAWRGYMEQMVERLCGEVAVQRISENLTSLGWSAGNASAMGQNASAVHDIPALAGALAAFTAVPLRQPSPHEIKVAQALSLANLVLDPRATFGNNAESGTGLLLRTLQHQAISLGLVPFDIPMPAALLPTHAEVPSRAEHGLDAAQQAKAVRHRLLRRRKAARG